MHDGMVVLLLAQPYPPRRHKPRNLITRCLTFFETDQSRSTPAWISTTCLGWPSRPEAVSARRPVFQL